jgi:ketosteroid isomerase-like protein
MCSMLKLLTATGVALLVAATMTNAQPTAPQSLRSAGDTPAAADAVKAAELARFTAQTTNDFTALDALLGADMVYTHSSAAVDDKASFIESMRSGAVKYESIEPRDLKIRVYGTTAVITGAGRFRVNARGQALDNQLRYTDVWVLRDGRWQMVSWQSTRLP